VWQDCNRTHTGNATGAKQSRARQEAVLLGFVACRGIMPRAMPPRPDEVYSLRKVGLAFALASLALLASLLWWVWVDHARPWREWQRQYHETRALLANKKTETTPAWFNLPLIDFLAPRGTPGRQEILQVSPPGIHHNLHFVRSQRTDRCMTCHAAIADPAFDTDHLAARGDSPPDLDHPLLAHPHLDLLVGKDSPHPMAATGCTVCHEGHGEETDFILARHTPASRSQKREWTRRHEVRLAGLFPEHTFETAREGWDRPMLPREYAEAGCTQCHERVTDIMTFDGRTIGTAINRGRFLADTLGCVNCHLVEESADARRVGTDLTHVAAKLGRGVLHHWLWRPRDVQPATRMPHSFGQENNDALAVTAARDSDPEGRTRAEVVAIAEYLLAASATYAPAPLPATDPSAGSAERGRQLFGSLGCLGCHAALSHRPDDADGNPADTLGVAWIADHLATQAEARLVLTQGREALTDEALDRIEDDAFARAEAMTSTEQAEYALRHLPQAGEGLFVAEAAREPVFTRQAPELSNLRGRIGDSPQAVAWLYDWLLQPRHYAPDTIMPDMRWQRPPAASHDEALDIAAYLLTLGDADATVWRHFDEDEVERARLATTRDELLNLPPVAHDDGMPGTNANKLMSESAEQSRARQEAVLHDPGNRGNRTLTGGVLLASPALPARPETHTEDQRRWVLLGERAIRHYGCASCHRIPGMETASRPGPELTHWADNPLDRLDFGIFHPQSALGRRMNLDQQHLYPGHREELIERAGENRLVEIAYRRDAFARHKLLNPRIWDRGQNKQPYDKLKMPNFFLSNRQIRALTTWLLSRRQSLVDAPVRIAYDNTPAGRLAAGRRLARELNCVGCHRLDGNQAVIDQYYQVVFGPTRVFDEENAPPPLRGQGAKTRPDWDYAYLRNVTTLRPWLHTRMPQFNLTPPQTADLVACFAGLAQAESLWLADRLAAVHKHNETPHPIDSSSIASPPVSAWFERPRLAATTQSLRRYAVRNRLVPAAGIDPAHADRDELLTAHAEILADAKFLSRLQAVAYPFTDDPPTLSSSPQRVADGEILFMELECLACHVFGDERAAGAITNPTAQNLDLTHRRLRRPWVQAWMEAPGRIQPGTKMPSHFGTGTTSAFAEFAPEYRERLRARLHDPRLVDDPTGQVAAITEFLYDTGARGLSKVQPVPADKDQAAKVSQ